MRKRVDQIGIAATCWPCSRLKNEFWNVKRDTAQTSAAKDRRGLPVGHRCKGTTATDNPAGEAIGYALPKNGVKT